MKDNLAEFSSYSDTASPELSSSNKNKSIIDSTQIDEYQSNQKGCLTGHDNVHPLYK